ncbi:MAG: alpha/beta fold hydrolase [Pseudomonadota bacterium]
MTAEHSRDKANSVIEALYELPLGGEWQDLQAVLCSYWSAAGTEPDDEEIALLERHFARALVFLEKVPNATDRWFNDLHRLPMAACVVDAHGDVVDANEKGRLLFGTEGREVRIGDANRDALRTTVRILRTQTLAATTLLFDNRSELRVYLSKMPVHNDSEAELFLGVIVSTDLPDVGLRLLAEQFHLTPAEANLCLQMSSGKSLDDIAAVSAVKKTTLRTHLANCFSKLGVNSQPELVALVLHHVFAGAHLSPGNDQPPRLTPFLDPEIHGFPKFAVHTLPDGRKLGYFEYGDKDGIPTIYCHGSFESGLFAKSQRLTGNGVRLIAVERGGVGESTPLPDPDPRAYAQDLLSLVDALGWTEYAVIGRSMGSWDAISLALADPQRARLLVFASCKLPVEKSSDHDEHLPVYRSLYNAIWHSRTMGRLMLRTLQLQLMLRGAEHFINSTGLPPIEKELSEDPTFHRFLKANWLRASCFGVDPIHDHLALYRDPVQDPPWRGLDTPTILVHGERDANVPLERILRQTESFRDRKVVVLNELGHMTVHTAMGEILRILRDGWRKG